VLIGEETGGMTRGWSINKSTRTYSIMKNNPWTSSSSGAGSVATLSEPSAEAGDAQFDEVKYQPSLRGAPSPRTLPPVVGPNAAIREIQEAVREHSSWVNPLRQELGRVIVGQERLLDRLLIALVTNGHVLLEGVPGLAKTLSLKTLAAAINVRFKRLQFTPDMLPADIVGTTIYNPQDGTFRVKHGPIFSNLVLADEINRAPAKVQSALLEGMQEHQVTIGDETFALPDIFLVLATQNPLEHEGTYPLPEAQLDRFMMKVIIDYPNHVEERAILEAMATTEPALGVDSVLSEEQILDARRVVNSIYIDDKIKEYIVNLVLATRDPNAAGLDLNGHIEYGASPRATINLTMAARASAFLAGRAYVTPQDVKNLAPDILRHRIGVSYEENPGHPARTVTTA
jgi:MoxR-like ATPase